MEWNGMEWNGNVEWNSETSAGVDHCGPHQCHRSHCLVKLSVVALTCCGYPVITAVRQHQHDNLALRLQLPHACKYEGAR